MNSKTNQSHYVKGPVTATQHKATFVNPTEKRQNVVSKVFSSKDICKFLVSCIIKDYIV